MSWAASNPKRLVGAHTTNPRRRRRSQSHQFYHQPIHNNGPPIPRGGVQRYRHRACQASIRCEVPRNGRWKISREDRLNPFRMRLGYRLFPAVFEHHPEAQGHGLRSNRIYERSKHFLTLNSCLPACDRRTRTLASNCVGTQAFAYDPVSLGKGFTADHPLQAKKAFLLRLIVGF